MSTTRRQPGRPALADGRETRDALLDAASRLVARDGAGAVSLRRIAHEAGVTPAMVHYYFGSKDGLYDAMLARTVGRVLARVRSIAKERDAPFDDRLGQMLDIVMSTYAAEPWLPALVVREVLADGGRLRERFIRDYASHMAKLLPDLMQAGIDSGRLRRDLDPRLGFISFLGMMLIPLVARPVLERALGMRYDRAFLGRFVAHTRQLFLEGAGA